MGGVTPLPAKREVVKRSSRIAPTSGRPDPPGDCPIDEVASLLASAWAPQILWYLCEGPRRFGDLRRDLKRASAKVMTTRLREMEALGIVRRKSLDTIPVQTEYSLTKLGEEFKSLMAVMASIGRQMRRQKI